MKSVKKLITILVLAIFLENLFLGSGLSNANQTSYQINKNSIQEKTSDKNEDVFKTNANLVSDTSKDTILFATPTSVDIKASPTSMVFTDKIRVQNSDKTNEIIVKYKDFDKSDEIKRKIILENPSLTLTSRNKIRSIKMETIQLSDNIDKSSIIEKLKADPNVEYAQPNYTLETFMVPQDNEFQQQWALKNNGQVINGQSGIAGKDINVLSAWDKTTGSQDVTVGVLDTGIDINHVDLKENIFVNKNEIPNDGTDNDCNGYIDDINGWDFSKNDNSLFDSDTEDKHGTHVAGTISAKNNTEGIVGVAPNVKILPLKFISGSVGYTSDAIEAISYAKQMGVKIINCSWGSSTENSALKDAMESSNIIFICASGNNGQNTDVNKVYPACFQIPNIISVAACDNKGEIASFSNYGSNINVVAPGVGIISTLPSNQYGLLNGTSMASPFVAAVTALVASFDNTLSLSEIKSRVLNNVSKSESFINKTSTWGLINAYASIMNEEPAGNSEIKAPVPTEIPGLKDKNPEPIYDLSAQGNKKQIKPIISENNLFIDACLDKNSSQTSSDGTGINNISINNIKKNYLIVTWTTEKNSTSEFYFGNTKDVDKDMVINESTTKHQLIVKEDNVSKINYFKIRSVCKDGSVFETDVRSINKEIIDLGGNEPTQVLKSKSSEINNTVVSQDVSTLSYTNDNNSNHSFASAQQIIEGNVFGTVAQGVGNDYYSVGLTAGKTYCFELKGMAVGEDYDIYLYNSAQSLIASSTYGSNYDEKITYSATTTGTYYLSVQPYTINTSSTHHNYQLMFYSTENSPDSYEANDSKDTAKTITNNTVIYPNLNINADEDWFVLNPVKIGKLSVSMKSIPQGCDYDIALYDANGNYLSGSYASSNGNEAINILINSLNKYYIRVYSCVGSDPNDTYELKAGVYTPDNYEVNDSLYDVLYNVTASINIGSCTSATIDNDDDIDSYKFILSNSTKVGVRLQNIPSGYDYDMVVYSYNSTNGFTEKGRSTNGSNADETLTVQLEAGSYYIKIYSYSGSTETQSYKLSLTDENSGIISMDFDKTSADVGDIVTATIKIDRITNFAGSQLNIKYDPSVVQPVDDSLQPYTSDTTPTKGNIQLKSSYSPTMIALNDLDKGILNFCTSYLNLTAYKQSGVPENSGTIGVIKFKVLKSNQIQIKFENTNKMPGNISGVLVYNWDGNKISGGFSVQQPQIINSSLPVNVQSFEDSSVEKSSVEDSSVILMDSGKYKVCGYIMPDSYLQYSSVKTNGFSVQIEGTLYSATSDDNGYYEIIDVPSAQNYTINISKSGYIKRVIKNVNVLSDIVLGKPDKPILMWPGDITQDDVVNMADVIKIACSFNAIQSDPIYNAICDLNSDNVINMIDVIIIAKYFNLSSSEYSSVESSNIQVSSSYTTTSKMGKIFDFVVKGKEIKTSCKYKVYVSYNPSELEAIDLCSITYPKNLSTGKVENTRINVTSYVPSIGSTSFFRWITVPSGKTWTGVINTIKFRAKKDGPIKILYILERLDNELIDPSAVFYYDFVNNFDDTIISDLTGNGYDGIVSNVSEVSDGAIFNGDNSKVLVSNSTGGDFNAPALTMEAIACVNVNEKTDGIITKSIMGKPGEYTDFDMVAENISATTCRIAFYLKNKQIIYSQELYKGVFYHIVCVYENSTFKLYVNGELHNTGNNVTKAENINSFAVGYQPARQDQDHYFYGSIKLAALYKEAWSDTKVFERFNVLNSSEYISGLVAE